MMDARLTLITAFTTLLARQAAAQFSWSGYSWNLRTNANSYVPETPGNNYFLPENVYTDDYGQLHMKMQYNTSTGLWTSAQLSSVQPFGFGRFTWKVNTTLENLDQNVVVGLFLYAFDPATQGPAGTNEIDIEFARWAEPTTPLLHYTVYPNRTGIVPGRTGGSLGTTGDSGAVVSRDEPWQTDPYPTSGVNPDSRGYAGLHTLTWCSESVHWSGTRIFQDSSISSSAQVQYSFATPASSGLIPQTPLAVTMNVWLFQQTPNLPLGPVNGENVEVVISAFGYREPPGGFC